MSGTEPRGFEPPLDQRFQDPAGYMNWLSRPAEKVAAARKRLEGKTNIRQIRCQDWRQPMR
jgi:hypothetical protein